MQFLFKCVLLILFPLRLWGQIVPWQVSEDDVVKVGLNQNLTLKQMQEKLGRYQKLVQEASAQRWAALDFESTFTHLSEVMELEFPGMALSGLPIQIPSQTIRFGDGNNYELSLKLTQPIFTGGRLSNAVKAALADFQATKFEKQVQENQMVFELKKAFYHLIQALEAEKIAQISIEQIQAHLKDVNNFYQQAQVTRNEVLTVEVKLAEAEQMLTRTQKGVRMAELGLLILLNEPLERPLTPKYDVVVWERNVWSVSDSVSVQDKPESRLLLSRLEGLNFRRQALKGAYWPTVGAFARLVYGKPGINQIANDWMDYWVAGISLQWNFWDWGKKSAQVQQVHFVANELSLGLLQMQQQLRADTKRCQLNVEEMQQQVRTTNKMLDRAEENFRMVSNQYEQGLVTNTLFLDAQTDLTRSRLQKIQYLVELQIAIADYARAMSQ